MYFIFIRRSRRRRRYDLLTFICGFRSCTFSTTILLLITIDFRLIMSSFHSLFLSISQDGRLNIIYALCECVVRTDDLRSTDIHVEEWAVVLSQRRQNNNTTNTNKQTKNAVYLFIIIIHRRSLYTHTYNTYRYTHIIAHTHTHKQTPHYLLTSSRRMA
jgi:hypothetical protein